MSKEKVEEVTVSDQEFSLATKEKKLRSGRTVVMRELTGVDEMNSTRCISKELLMSDSQQAIGYAQSSVLALMAIVDYFGKGMDYWYPKNEQDFTNKMASIPRKDFMEILGLHLELNEAGGNEEDFLDKSTD